jgi:hypothetical protein
MADISGYTAFVGGTEQEHSQEIVAELMDGISRSFGGKLTIDQVEGDALCSAISGRLRPVRAARARRSRTWVSSSSSIVERSRATRSPVGRSCMATT